MKSLTLRIYLTVVAVLLLFALVAGWVAQRNFDHDRQWHQRGLAMQRYAALGELIENTMPPEQAPVALQAEALRDLSRRLRVPMALDDDQGQRLVTDPRFALWETRTQSQQNESDDSVDRDPEDRPKRAAMAAFKQVWSDGRVLWLLRPEGMPPRVLGNPPETPSGWLFMPWLPGNFLIALLLLFVAVATGAWPVARRLTRRLKALQAGVERFGEGQLTHRVDVQGKDEVAELASSFNQAADRIETLVTSHRSLLANASHELRSPLARLKMAVSMFQDAPQDKTQRLRAEIDQNIHELDALVEEVLLASRLDTQTPLQMQATDVEAVVQQEAKRMGADVYVHAQEGAAQLHAFTHDADERLLRRAVRNLLENAARYGVAGDGSAQVEVALHANAHGLDIRVMDRGPGVPADQRERIFEPFYRMSGHAEHAGGVGLGLSLVRQIVERHMGTVHCEVREGGGSVFVIRLPKAPCHAAPNK